MTILHAWTKEFTAVMVCTKFDKYMQNRTVKLVQQQLPEVRNDGIIDRPSKSLHHLDATNSDHLPGRVSASSSSCPRSESLHQNCRIAESRHQVSAQELLTEIFTYNFLQ